MWKAILRSRSYIPKTTTSRSFLNSLRSHSRTITTSNTSKYPQLEPQPQPKPKPTSKPKSNENPGSLPTAGFQVLGATRMVKIVVVSCVSIAATMESIFWGKMMWARYGPAEEVEAGIEEKGRVEGGGQDETKGV